MNMDQEKARSPQESLEALAASAVVQEKVLQNIDRNLQALRVLLTLLFVLVPAGLCLLGYSMVF